MATRWPRRFRAEATGRCEPSMRYAELQKLARELSPEAMRDNLRSLAMDSRFAAVVALIEAQRESYVTAGSAQNMASDHGKLAHCQGSVYALRTITGQFQQILDRPAQLAQL